MTADEQLDMETLKHRINGETARIQWHELERHFAQGSVIRIAAGNDLVEVACAMVLDDRDRIDVLLSSGAMCVASVEDATRWQGTSLWAVVVAPWVLVQDEPVKHG